MARPVKIGAGPRRSAGARVEAWESVAPIAVIKATVPMALSCRNASTARCNRRARMPSKLAELQALGSPLQELEAAARWYEARRRTSA